MADNMVTLTKRIEILEQRIEVLEQVNRHVAGIATPQYLDQQMQQLQDKMYELQNKLNEVL